LADAEVGTLWRTLRLIFLADAEVGRFRKGGTGSSLQWGVAAVPSIGVSQLSLPFVSVHNSGDLSGADYVEPEKTSETYGFWAFGVTIAGQIS